MADNRPVLVKVLHAKSPLDRAATFTGEEKKAKLVRKHIQKSSMDLADIHTDTIPTDSLGSGNHTLRRLKLYRPRSKSQANK